MKLDELGLDRIKIFGQPFHGLWKSGSITLPNATTKTCPAPANGGVVLLRVPDQPAVVRSTEEQDADTAAGREWRNYGLISGGRYGASDYVYGDVGTATVIFIDAENISWLMHIIWPYTVSYMTVKVRRFGHFVKPWIETAWSPSINVEMDPDFMPALVGSHLLTICQNTTGREFVLGGVNLGSGTNYCNGMIRVNVSGTIDVEAADLGLAFSGVILGGEKLTSGSETDYIEVTGSHSEVVVTTWLEYDSSISAYTGQTEETTYIRTDGTVVRNDSRPPPGAVYPLTWVQGSDVKTYPSDQVLTQSRVMEAAFPLWAAYVEDSLKLLTITAVYVDINITAATEFNDYSGYGGAATWHALGSNDISCELTYDYGGHEIEHAFVSASLGADVHVADSQGPGVLADSEAPISVSFSAILGWLNEAQGSASISCAAPLVIPLTKPYVSWATPCVAKAVRNGCPYPGTYTWSTTGVAAPGGVSVATTIALSSLGATWNPVTGELEIDSTPVCWF